MDIDSPSRRDALVVGAAVAGGAMIASTATAAADESGAITRSQRAASLRANPP